MNMYKRKEIYLSGKSVFTNITTDAITKPYNGLYIYKDKLLVSNISEKIEINNNIYDISNYTNSKEINKLEYLSDIDFDNNIFKYDIEYLNFQKKISYLEDDILEVEYFIENNSNEDANFKIIPYLTYRDVLYMKKINLLKFTNKIIDNGIMVNLNITDNINVIIKSDNLNFNEKKIYLTDIKHEYTNSSLSKKVFIEDLYSPGYFKLLIKGKSKTNVKIYISNKDFDKTQEKEYKCNINNEYIELKKLVCCMSNFDSNYLTSTIPSIEKNILDIVKSIDGRYIVLNKLKEADELIKKIINLDNDILIKLWLSEIINKLYEKDNKYKYTEFLTNLTFTINNDILNNRASYLKNIEYITLAYNLFKIYENMVEDNKYSDVIISLKKSINEDFFDNNKNILKNNLDDECMYATPEMLYSISLSYSSVDNDISIKLLDTAFKELYTPFGLRKISKKSSNYNFLVYPKYMAHFVKANLRQNGVTYASQKISYNLVKELLQEIDNNISNGVKSVYHEKNIPIDTPLDMLTIAELIRVYDMLI